MCVLEFFGLNYPPALLLTDTVTHLIRDTGTDTVTVTHLLRDPATHLLRDPATHLLRDPASKSRSVSSGYI